MAAYAAVVSLMNNMELMQNHPCYSFTFDKEQIECLRQNVGFLLDFLESYSHRGSKEAEDLETQIASAAQEADDAIESHIVDQIHAGSLFYGESSHGEWIKSCFLDCSDEGSDEDLIESGAVHQIRAGSSTVRGETSPEEWFKSVLLNLLEACSDGGSREEGESSESQIASAAHEADDVVESHLVDQSIAGFTPHREMSIAERIKSLLIDLETSSRGAREEAEASGTQITSADQKANDAVESHGETSSCFLANLQRVIENMDSVKQMVMKVENQRYLKDQLDAYSAPAASSKPLTPGKSTLVGLDDELIQLMDVLTGQQSSRQVSSITGMGGIGKTTLAKNVFENSLIKQHFDIRIWATISQDYSTKRILSELLSCQGKSTAELDLITVDELGEQLHKILWGRRYLIILDDIWSIDVWDTINVFFPDNHNKSRIIVTSRQSKVANRVGSSCLKMNFLDEEKSWNLFCLKAFSEQGCPSELEEVGKKILKKCKGLPLLVVLIGGHLQKSSKAKAYWEIVATDINTVLDSGVEEQCFDLLTLSYNYLPAHLKPCFLYMGILHEDDQISVSTLIKLWVAEGFLKTSESQSLEEVAEDCLKDLVDRNLILVCEWSWSGKIKTCSVHDLLRELCLKIATKEMFFYVVKLNQTPLPIKKERRLVVNGIIPEEKFHSTITRAMESSPLVRSLLSKGKAKGIQLSCSRLLKVAMDVAGVTDEVDEKFLMLRLQHFNLRFLDYNFYDLLYASVNVASSRILPLCLPSSICMLWNLQTLYIRGFPDYIVAPAEFWMMSQLRHVEVGEIYLLDPPLVDQQNGLLVLQNLQTLLKVMNFRLSEDVCERIPNIKKLHVEYGECLKGREIISYYSPMNFGLLHKLESLRCSIPKGNIWRYFVLSFKFPSSLQKLYLETCSLSWDDLTIIGTLPHLEVLKLKNAVTGPEWNPVEGEFLRLKFLKVSLCYELIDWNAESCHFPVLEKLVLEHFHALNEIPLGIGEIPTLQFISLVNCSVPVAISAMRIMVEQESLGNEDLQLEVEFWGDEELESFREIAEGEDLSSNNLRLRR